MRLMIVLIVCMLFASAANGEEIEVSAAASLDARLSELKDEVALLREIVGTHRRYLADHANNNNCTCKEDSSTPAAAVDATGSIAFYSSIPIAVVVLSIIGCICKGKEEEDVDAKGSSEKYEASEQTSSYTSSDKAEA